MAGDRKYFEDVLERLQPLGEVTGKAMFGGFGFWESGAMFALLDSSGRLFLKADEETAAAYREAGSAQFEPHGAGGRTMLMPYWTVPDEVLADEARFERWAERAVAVGHSTAMPKRSRPARTAGRP